MNEAKSQHFNIVVSYLKRYAGGLCYLSPVQGCLPKSGEK